MIEAEAPGRQFRMEHVNLKVDADTDRQMRVDLLSGRFAGTIAADRMVMHGTVDFTGDGPACDLALSVTGCRPSALGAGIDIDDPVSVSARVKGPAARPVITGTLDIPELNVTALLFTELTGDFHYEAGLLSVEAVKGKVFGGTVEGTGRFDLDKRSYGADIQGTASAAARRRRIRGSDARWSWTCICGASGDARPRPGALSCPARASTGSCPFRKFPAPLNGRAARSPSGMW